MIELKPINFLDIKSYFQDFQKLSNCFEMPTDDAVPVGIFEHEKLIGYYILAGYDDGTLEIQQGYLLPEARNKRNHYRAMQLLETEAKDKGFKTILLQSQRSLRAYSHFMRRLNFRPVKIVYQKEI